MKIHQSAGRLPKNVDVRDRCAKLELVAIHSNQQSLRFEQELLARIAFELKDSGVGYFLNQLRKMQAKSKNAPESQGEIPE